MASSPSAIFLRLRASITKRRRMSPIDQLLMLMELLGRHSPAPAQDIARYGTGAYALIGGDELSDRGNVSGREWGSGVIEGKPRY